MTVFCYISDFAVRPKDNRRKNDVFTEINCNFAARTDYVIRAEDEYNKIRYEKVYIDALYRIVVRCSLWAG
jgi:hypothetical protein